MSKKWDYSDIQNWGPGRHEVGATIPESGTADDYETGGWRTDRPVLDMEKCNHCMICFWGCPDSAITVKDSKLTGFALKHCKGCGICKAVCPRSAIEMSNEKIACELEEK
ncbi:MAG: pyruvate ferredoxin oxidoreductase [Gaiellales bacterium]|nr:MAG: pyruvate ferredoxin oxidoreductase [Gaiellales bacterium]